jgi:FkbM family methyltransferase
MQNKPMRFIVALTCLLRKRSWGPFTEAFETSRFDHAFSISWSQAGEDLALMPILGKITNGRYLDVGAHHPSRFSVTRHLFQSGWSGVNVDGNVDLLREFEAQRPKDLSLNFCVGTQSSYTLNVFNETAISTVDSAWKSKFLSEDNAILESREVQGITLRTLIEKYFSNGDLDFLNIDIEGADLDALISADFSNLEFMLWPKWVLVEANAPLSVASQSAAVQHLHSFGYQIYLVLPYACLLQKPQTKK